MTVKSKARCHQGSSCEVREFANCSSAKKTAGISSEGVSLGILLARANSVQAHADARSLIILSARADSQGSCKCREFEYTVIDRFLPVQSLVQREAEGRRGSKPQGLLWLRSDAPQGRVDARVSDMRESSTQDSRSLQCWFWVGSERGKLRTKALKSEQGFGCSRASFAWAKPCQASRGTEHAGGIKVDIRTKGKYSEVGTD